MKKNSILIILFFLSFGSFTGCKSTDGGKVESAVSSIHKVGLVTDTGGLNDESFNETSWKGLLDLQKEYAINVKALESKRDEDYVPNLTKLAREPRDMIWGVGFKFEKVIPEMAVRFPNQNFGIIDSALQGTIPSNVTSLTFRDHEGSFLVGVIAGLTTKTNEIGFIGGISSPLVKKFEAGYIAGIKYVNSKAKVRVAYAESFTDETKGRSLSSSMYNNNVDIIYHASGGVGKGIFNEVKTREKGKYWVIGVDTDQSRLAPDHTLTSMIKRLDLAIKTLSLNIIQKKNNSNNVELTLKDDGLTFIKSNKIKPEILSKLKILKTKVIAGSIKIPQSDNELQSFFKVHNIKD